MCRLIRVLVLAIPVLSKPVQPHETHCDAVAILRAFQLHKTSLAPLLLCCSMLLAPLTMQPGLLAPPTVMLLQFQAFQCMLFSQPGSLAPPTCLSHWTLLQFQAFQCFSSPSDQPGLLAPPTCPSHWTLLQFLASHSSHHVSIAIPSPPVLSAPLAFPVAQFLPSANRYSYMSICAAQDCMHASMC